MTPYFAVNNRSQNWDYSDILEEASITEDATEKGDGFRVKLSDIGNTILLPKKGERVGISIGQNGVANNVGDYVIDEIEMGGPPDYITIAGHACPFDNSEGWGAMQTRKSRSWDNVTIGDLINAIAAEHGMQPGTDPTLATVQIVHLDQTSESDMNLLTRLGRMYGAVFRPSAGSLLFTPYGLPSTGAASNSVSIARGPGMKYRCNIAKRDDVAGVTTSYHDPDAGVTNTVTAGTTSGNAVVRKEGALHNNSAQATIHASTKLKKLKMGSCGLWLSLPGMWAGPATSTDLAAQKLTLTLSGFRPEANGLWIVKKREFTLRKSDGLRTIMDCDTPGDGTQLREQLLGNADGSADSASEDNPATWNDGD